ncbi:chemotaxis protein CheA [Halorientalis regularis]|uniref:Chemotaxis protein CheA n=1 Tax=Halorientalis regularis TaxID=660518 RepID=A0A1G7KV29_9EURY|nr:chemotaxis protein CheA [Halorientalis regularis]SDF41083.1 two-component system, chemotaxis family, sensor kinase CheA [Halorientalis regularis]
MDDQYLDAFIRESEEAITELNNSLLALESDPEDEQAMESIFRTAHTLKGNFGAMGFEDASDLAHAIEDLLDEMREGNMEVTPEVMDMIFAGVDQIEVIVSEIEEHGESTTDTDEMVAEIRGVLEDGPDAADDGGDAGSDAAEEASDDTAESEGDDADDGADDGETDVTVDTSVFADASVDADEAYHVRVEIGDSNMLGVDGMLAVEAVADTFGLLAAEPARAKIEDGEYEGGFDLLVDAPDTDVLRGSLSSVSKIDAFAVEHVDQFADDGEDGSDSGETAASTDSSVDEIKSVRVDVDRLDELHGQVEQLVTSRIKLRRAVADGDMDAAGENLNELDKISANLQNTVMDMRLIPLKKVVGKFPRLVRDLARELDKEVDFRIEGEDIELDRTILTEISDPLMHILRNAVDHGIEPPEERERKGKPREGTVELRATRERDHVIIEVEDDGAGLDVADIREQALEHGVRTEEELDRMEEGEIYDLAFHPGLSTKDEVTDTSGRGVGMDVVHDTVTQLDGSVSVDSEPGEGTTVSLRLPVTMAIVKVLFVQVGDEQYGVPIKNIDEISQMNGTKIINGEEVIEHNDDIYPIVDIAEAFDVPDAKTNGDGMLVRIRESERQVALKCDAVTQQEEVVVKPLEGILSGTPGLSGTAVLGDGNIVHILDVVTL